MTMADHDLSLFVDHDAFSVKTELQQQDRAYVSEESQTVKEATESMEELSVDTNSVVASSDAAAETSNPTSIPAADN